MRYKTITEKRGYTYANGSAGKRWYRGRTMYSEGRKYEDGERIWCLAKTNLDTGEITECTLKEYEKFLTKEAYEDFLINKFNKMAERG